MSDVPLTSELRYTIGSRHSLRRKIQVKARTVFDCDFGAAPLNSENCIVHLVLKNDGAVSTEWYVIINLAHDLYIVLVYCQEVCLSQIAMFVSLEV